MGAWIIETDGQPEVDTFAREDFVEAWLLYADVMTTWANNSDDAYEASVLPENCDMDDDPDTWGSDGATVAGYLADAKCEVDYEHDHSFTLHANDGSTVVFTLRWDTESDPNQ